MSLGDKFQSVVNMIDDKYGNENISNAFADKYCELWNSVSFDKNIMAKLLWSKLSGKFSNECLSKGVNPRMLLRSATLLIPWKNLKLVN